MKDLIKKLREEHAHILQMIESQQDILKIIEFVEGSHHPLEEIHLFPKMASHPLLREGGPLCTYFRSIDLDINPKAPMFTRLEKFYEQGGPKPSPYQEFSWLSEQNPLSIPMDEHKLGHELAQAIQFLSDQKDSALGMAFYSRFCEDYLELLHRHIDKEDNCLFVMCERMSG